MGGGGGCGVVVVVLLFFWWGDFFIGKHVLLMGSVGPNLSRARP